MRKLLPLFLALVIAAPILAQTKPSAKRPTHSRAASLTPLTQRERALQLLNRFTFGPRPGDIEKVMAETPEKWFERQLNPVDIPDDALNKRLSDYPSINLSPDRAVLYFPDRAMIQQVADGRHPYPTEPFLMALYEVQVYKLSQESNNPKADTSVSPTSESEAATTKSEDQATAARIAGVLFALPKEQRMATLIRLPLSDRVAFTTYVAGEQKNLLLASFNPRERELFNAMAANNASPQQLVNELSQAKLLRAILSERQVQEVMTDFWFNHFNVFIHKDSDRWYTSTYERDTIRAHALGKFRDLLLATATSPAMMVYLDNWQSIGPDSLANGVSARNPKAKKGDRGLNENYGREVMELHTVGVNGGYTQADVTALSAILTGWTVDRPNQGGSFTFDPKKHEPGPKTWLGYTIDDTGQVISSTTVSRPSNVATPDGMKQGITALTLLAASPKTANFVSYKLAQRFVADEPPPALVARMAATYLATDGDIKAILLALVRSPEFNSRKYFRNKVKTPTEFIASAFRTTATDPANPGALVNTLRTMGMPLYSALPPTGYYITADKWMNSGALIDRLNFAYALTGNKFANQRFDSAHVLALGLMSQPAGEAAARAPHANYAEAIFTSRLSSANLAGPDIALHVLESTLVGGDVSPQTNQLIHKQIAQLSEASSTSTLNMLTALVMGSPEFQLR
jgi:uncharacterized protein (DUF1800 family)